MKRRFRFTIRTLLLLLVLSSLPCWWIAVEMAQYRTEQDAMSHMRDVNPRTSVVWTNQSPKWLNRLGVSPKWMDRITRVDATGVTCGNLKWEDFPKSQIDFGDENLDEIADDLGKLTHLTEIYFQVTKLTDKSIDNLAELPNIKMLCLHETDVTDAGAQELQSRLPLTEVDHHRAGSK